MRFEFVAPNRRPTAGEVVDVAAIHRASVQVAWYEPDTASAPYFGELADYPAWSTGKVPVALAVCARGAVDEQVASDIHAAITVSDNDAALRLWARLGTDLEASRLVTEVLRAGGDVETVVPSRRLFEPWSIVGQTQWAPAAQVRFLRGLPELPGADRLLAELGDVVADQHWALGRRPGAMFKGGWGPGRLLPAATARSEHGVTTRQMGYYPQPGGGHAIISVIAQLPGDDENAGFAVLNDLVDLFG